MATKVKTFTVDELIAQLSKYPSDTKVFLSTDAEGNGFGSIDGQSFSLNKLDECIAIYPSQEHLEYDDVFAKTYEREMSE